MGSAAKRKWLISDVTNIMSSRVAWHLLWRDRKPLGKIRLAKEQAPLFTACLLRVNFCPHHLAASIFSDLIRELQRQYDLASDK
jgi:hypothetical protein